MQQPDGKGQPKHLLRRRALPLLVALLLVAVALAVLYFRYEQGAASGGRRRAVEDLPQPFRWFAQRREAALLKEIETLTKVRDERSFQRLLVLSVDRDETVRNQAINNTLGNYRVAPFRADEQAMRRLLNALEDRNPDVRTSAAEVLGWLRDTRAVEPLIATLRDAEADVRWVAALELGALEDPRAAEPLNAALKDADDRVRENAAGALGWLKDRRAVEPLIAVLKDAEADVRSSAACALGELRDARAVEPLIATLKDTDPNVRANAAGALKAITGMDFGKDAEKWRAWWKMNKERYAKPEGRNPNDESMTKPE